MTPLEEHLIARIRATGPLSIADYMAECLMHPRHGYYATRDPLGRRGDFVTAPEISQMFGELLGLALAQSWLDRGSPAPFRLVELGPGRGTLMADCLRATARVPGFHAALDLHFVETSPVLRARQRETIAHDLTHHDHLADVPEGPLFVVANEFFDALPIRQFRREDTGWRECVVGIDHDRLAPGLSDPANPVFLEDRLSDTRPGDIVEHPAPALAIAAEIGRRISHDGGVALIVDYGDWRSLGDTLQALKAHERVSPFEAPGEADLTAHVDFEALARAAHPSTHTRLTPQGVVLERLGITPRAQTLARSMSSEALDAHNAAHRRLTHADEMGTLFKAMALYQTDSPLPPGFEP
jgi:SAM-dependent MidA family methyltransferase